MRKFYWKHGWAKVPDEMELAGKKQNTDLLMKDVDMGEPTSFFDHFYLGCTLRECQSSKNIVDNYWIMFEPRISAGALEKLPSAGKIDANISSWSYDMQPIQ